MHDFHIALWIVFLWHSLEAQMRPHRLHLVHKTCKYVYLKSMWRCWIKIPGFDIKTASFAWNTPELLHWVHPEHYLKQPSPHTQLLSKYFQFHFSKTKEEPAPLLAFLLWPLHSSVFNSPDPERSLVIGQLFLEGTQAGFSHPPPVCSFNKDQESLRLRI